MMISHPETPTKTTNTTAYVAVATNLSVLLALKNTDNAPANNKIETDTVTKLLVTATSGRRMMSIGTTNMVPPKNATMNRVSISTNWDTSSGGSPMTNSSVCFRRLLGV